MTDNSQDQYDDTADTEIEIETIVDDDDQFRQAEDATQKRINRLTKKMREAERQTSVPDCASSFQSSWSRSAPTSAASSCERAGATSAGEGGAVVPSIAWVLAAAVTASAVSGTK